MMLKQVPAVQASVVYFLSIGPVILQSLRNPPGLCAISFACGFMCLAFSVAVFGTVYVAWRSGTQDDVS